MPMMLKHGTMHTGVTSDLTMYDFVSVTAIPPSGATAVLLGDDPQELQVKPLQNSYDQM